MTSTSFALGTAVARPSVDEMTAAAAKQSGVTLRTPLVPFRGSSVGEPGRILLKPEIHQPIGSFKLRGVFHAVSSMSAEERERGLSTVSAGNTAQALAWCAQRFDVAAYALMPDSAPQSKVAAVRALGGIPRLVERSEVFRFLREGGWLSEPYAFVHPWIDRRVIVGHSSLGLEIGADLDNLKDPNNLREPGPTDVYVPVGGGGLIAGTASALAECASQTRIVAVEPSGCPALNSALERGEPVDVECKTMCDGIAIPFIMNEIFPLLQELVDEVVLVEEDSVRRAIRDLALDNKMIVEASGAITVAAARQRAHPERTAVCVLSGGSIEPAQLIEALSY